MTVAPAAARLCRYRYRFGLGVLVVAVAAVVIVTPTHAIGLLPTCTFCLVGRFILEAIGEGIGIFDERGATSRCAERDVVMAVSA